MTPAGRHPKARPGWREEADLRWSKMAKHARRKVGVDAYFHPKDGGICYDLNATAVRRG